MIERSETPLDDYGGLHRSTEAYWRAQPADSAELRALLLAAARDRVPVRLRGAGHSMNGTAVPRGGELLIATARLDRFTIDTSSTITVEAGAKMWDVHRMLMQHGASLRVLNDGNAAASTVGGYISAGGFGATSWIHGGFWETVERIRLLTVDGEALDVRPDDELFRWLFGSMGQLAVITEATLKVDRIHLAASQLPVGSAGRVEASAHDWERIVWLSVFTPRHGWAGVRDALVAIGDRHASAWAARPPYVYAVPYKRFHPPLIHPAQEDLVVVGIWGEAPFEARALVALEDEFDAWLAGNPQARRYVQTERLPSNFDFERHFGSECFAAFRQWKHELDPSARLGRGIFPEL